MVTRKHYEVGQKVVVLPFEGGTEIGGVYMAIEMKPLIGKTVTIREYLGITNYDEPMYKISHGSFTYPHSVFRIDYNSKEELMKDVFNSVISVENALEIQKENGWN